MNGCPAGPLHLSVTVTLVAPFLPLAVTLEHVGTGRNGIVSVAVAMFEMPHWSLTWYVNES